MKNNPLIKINRNDLKYIIASSFLMVLLLIVIGYGLFFLVEKSSQIAGFPKKKISVDNTSFNIEKLQEFKNNFPLFWK